MSQYSTTGLVQFSRNDVNARNARATDLAGSIQIPGLAAPGVPYATYINQDEDLALLLHAFNLAGQVAEQAGGMAARNRAEIERDNAKQEAINGAVAAQTRNLDIPELEQAIRERKIQVPPGESPSVFAESFAKERLAGFGETSPEFQREYMKVAPQLADRLETQAAQDSEKAKGYLVKGLSDQAFLAKTPAEASSYIDKAKLLGLTEAEAYSKIIMPALATAAGTGNKAQFDVLASTLAPGQNAADVATLKLHLAAEQARIESQTQQNAMQMLTGLMSDQQPWVVRDALEQFKGILSPSNYEAMERRISEDERQRHLSAKADATDRVYSLALHGSVDDAKKYALSMESVLGAKDAVDLNNGIEAAFAERKRAERAAQEEAGIQAIMLETLQATRSGTPLLAAATHSEFKVGDKTVAVTPAKKIEYVQNVELNRLAVGKTPQQAIVDQIDWAAQQGTYPSVWDHRIEAAMTEASGLLENKPPSQNMLDSFMFYRHARQQAGPWASGLGTEKSRAFFDAAIEHLADTRTNGQENPAAALRAAAVRFAMTPADKARIFSTIRDKDISKYTKRVVPVGSIKNPDAVAGEIQSLAYLRAESNIPAETALQGVADDLKGCIVVINGWASIANAEGMTDALRSELPKLGEKIAGDYAKATKEAPDKYTLIYNRARNLWEINDTNLGVPVYDPAHRVQYSTEELDQMMRDEAKASADKALSASIDKNKATMEKFKPEETIVVHTRREYNEAQQKYLKRQGPRPVQASK